jgi:hypothetical protein
VCWRHLLGRKATVLETAEAVGQLRFACVSSTSASGKRFVRRGGKFLYLPTTAAGDLGAIVGAVPGEAFGTYYVTSAPLIGHKQTQP